MNFPQQARDSRNEHTLQSTQNRVYLNSRYVLSHAIKEFKDLDIAGKYDFLVNYETAICWVEDLDGETRVGAILTVEALPNDDDELKEILARVFYSIQRAFDKSSARILKDQDQNTSLVTFLRGNYPYVLEVSGENFEPGDFLESWNDYRPFQDNQAARNAFELLPKFTTWDSIDIFIDFLGSIHPGFGTAIAQEFNGFETQDDFRKVNFSNTQASAYLERLYSNARNAMEN